jgi:hypothetical protein
MKTKEYFKARIPVQDAYVYQFIVNRYGNGTNVIRLSKKNLLGTLIELSAERICYQHTLPKRKFDQPFFIEVQFTDRLKNHYLSPQKLLLFSEYFEKHFKDIFLLETEVLVSVGVSDYEAVQRFLIKYDLQENATIADTLRKRWRDRQKYLKKIIEKNLVELYPSKLG